MIVFPSMTTTDSGWPTPSLDFSYHYPRRTAHARPNYPKGRNKVADQRDPETLISMTLDGENFAQTTLGALNQVWSRKGWKEAKSEDVEARADADAFDEAAVPANTKSAK